MFGKLFGKDPVANIKNEAETNKLSDTISEEVYPDKNNINDQIKWLISSGWTESYSINKKTLLLMDDREEIISSIMDDLQSLDFENVNFNLSDYNIIKVHSKMAGFLVIDILKHAPLIEIDYALLDIVLGGKKVIDDKRVMVDGVDVAIKIWNYFKNADIMFFSGCIIDDAGKDIFNFKDKFTEYTNDKIDNYLLPKDSNFDDELIKLGNFLGIN